jgi:hypothetical protein
MGILRTVGRKLGGGSGGGGEGERRTDLGFALEGA